MGVPPLVVTGNFEDDRQFDIAFDSDADSEWGEAELMAIDNLASTSGISGIVDI